MFVRICVRVVIGRRATSRTQPPSLPSCSSASTGLRPTSRTRQGKWQHFAPSEIIHNYLFAIARDTAVPDNHARMKNWRFFLLTTVFPFVVCTGDVIYWRQARIREGTEVAFPGGAAVGVAKCVRDQLGLRAADRAEVLLERAVGGALREALAAGGVQRESHDQLHHGGGALVQELALQLCRARASTILVHQVST